MLKAGCDRTNLQKPVAARRRFPKKIERPRASKPDRFQPLHFKRDTTSKDCPTELKIVVTEIVMGTILLIILILFLVGALPTWPYSAGWGYYPTGGLGLILVIVLVLVLFRLI